MSAEHADPMNARRQGRAHDPQETEAVRETVAEWMEKQSRRVASGAYLADLEDEMGGRNPVLDVCFLALQGAGMAYTVAEAYRDEPRMDAASELEEEVGAAVRAVLPPEAHDDVFSDAFDAVGDRVEGLDGDAVTGTRRDHHIEAGRFTDDGTFTGNARCWMCATVAHVEEADAWKLEFSASIAGVPGTYLDALCPTCASRLFVPDDGELSPVKGKRGARAGSSPGNGSGNPARSVEGGDTVELPRELAERLVRQVGLLHAADCTLIDMSPRDFLDMEVARRTAREYASRLRGALGDLEERLGYGDGDALTDRLHHECKILEAEKRRELAEELEGGAS